MNRIQALPESVKRKIAAGEVVEGPFSIVKELMENSIDAGATAIDVEIFEGGMKKIVVRDNGHGMYGDDLLLAVQEHATSKIHEIDDIEAVATYGFRGEALSSISAIAHMSIFTRTKDEEIGARLDGGDSGFSVKDYAGPVGTSVIVENLFFNVPARKKFLKARSTEVKYIRENFLTIALSRPHIAFSLSRDGKRQITLPVVENIDGRIKQIYNDETLHQLYFDTLSDLKVEISGYLSRPGFFKGNRSMQLIYVNGRPFEYRYLGYLLSRAYESMIRKGQYPMAFLFVAIDPALVDVNIHPAKREVKFFDQRYIDGLIVNLARKVLGNRIHTAEAETIMKEDALPGKDLKTDLKNESFGKQSVSLPFSRGSGVRRIASFSGRGREQISGAKENSQIRPLVRDAGELYTNLTRDDGYRILGTIFNTYIVAEEEDSLLIIDFHAAHERRVFDSLMSDEYIPETQRLVFPQVLELGLDEYELVVDSMDIFKEIGFDIEALSDNTIAIQGIPEVTHNFDFDAFFHETVDSLKAEKALTDVKKMVLERIACHSAKRASDELSREEMGLIVKSVVGGEHELRCPHGRPLSYKIRKNDIERMFQRI